jgi:FkbM family methyltransferase
MKIEKIELVNERQEIININKEKLDLFFLMSKFDAKKPFDSLKIKDIGIEYILQNLFFATLRKILRRKPAITEGRLLRLFTKNKSKKIILVNVYFSNRQKMTFDIEKIHLLNLLGDLRGVVQKNQYNINEKEIKGKVVIDAGAHNGEFSLLAALMGAKKVYAFEPVSETSKILSRNIDLSGMNNKIKVISKALGDKNEEANISFDFVGDGSAKILKNNNGEDKHNSEKIKIIQLDGFVKKEKITNIGFIKMDVEGFEENVLIGSKKTIKRDKPILSLSAYHKTSDKKILPAIIRAIRKDYKIKLVKEDEEDLYCY